MKALVRHLSKCFVAGVVALLPIGGLVLMVVWLEVTISGSWLARQAWYFPGLGLVAAAVLIYLIGLVVTTVLGRWLWSLVDRLLHRLPLLGQLYGTLKQVLGYGEGGGALFQQVVLVPDRAHGGAEIGLVTHRRRKPDGREELAVFVPGSPNPGAGRLVLIEPDAVRPLNVSVHDALKALVAAGATVPEAIPMASAQERAAEPDQQDDRDSGD